MKSNWLRRLRETLVRTTFRRTPVSRYQISSRRSPTEVRRAIIERLRVKLIGRSDVTAREMLLKAFTGNTHETKHSR